ncbi:hypothetical protein IJ732_07125 [bacterium]|nr:hypothetical protein [bacterium]
MITKEVNDWLKKIECGMYSPDDIMYEFQRISKYLTMQELKMIKKKLLEYITNCQS